MILGNGPDVHISRFSWGKKKRNLAFPYLLSYYKSISHGLELESCFVNTSAILQVWI